MECPKSKTCMYSETPSLTCNLCVNFSYFEPIYPPKSLVEMLDLAMLEGAGHFQLFREDHMFGGEWHWDIFDKDPHVWFRIPKIWTFRVHLTPWRMKLKQYGRQWWRRLPLSFCWDSWTFTYYKNDTVQGCQCIGGSKIDYNRGLMYAVNNFHCALVEEVGNCGEDCTTCDHLEIASVEEDR